MLEWLSDVGGLIIALHVLGSFLVARWGRIRLWGIQTSELFVWPDSRDHDHDEVIREPDCYSCCLKSCGKNLDYKEALQVAEADIHRSLDLVSLVMQLRVHGLALRNSASAQVDEYASKARKRTIKEAAEDLDLHYR